MTKIISISLTNEDAVFLENNALKPSHIFREAIHNLRIAGRLDVFRENEELKQKVQKLATLIQTQQEKLNVLEQEKE